MIGVCHTSLNEHNEALMYITLAYIEDTLNSDLDEENEADETPAGQMLIHFYYVNTELLTTIKKYVNKIKNLENGNQLFEPLLDLLQLYLFLFS